MKNIMRDWITKSQHFSAKSFEKSLGTLKNSTEQSIEKQLNKLKMILKSLIQNKKFTETQFNLLNKQIQEVEDQSNNK